MRKSPRSIGRVDWFGAITVTGALVTLVYAIVTAETVGWASAQILVLLAVAAVLLVIFLVIQAARREPLLPLAIFKAPNLAAGNLVMGLRCCLDPAMVLPEPLPAAILGLSALSSGLALLPMATRSVGAGPGGDGGDIVGQNGGGFSGGRARRVP